MNRGLAADLARWERGEVASDAVLADADPQARDLVEMHAWLSVLTAEPEVGGPSFSVIEARLERLEADARDAGAEPSLPDRPRRPIGLFLGWPRIAPSNP